MSRAWRWSIRKILGLWVKATIKPEDAAAVVAARSRPVCYVLERESRTDLAVLDNACAQLQLPRPERRLTVGNRRSKAYFELELVRRAPFRRTRGHLRAPRYLVQLVEAAAADANFDVDLVPVAIFWGRAPLKEDSLWRLLFTEDWVLVGRFRKLLKVVFNGRNTVVYFGEPIPLRQSMCDLTPPRSVRRLLRSLRAELRAQRASTIGPDLSHRRTMVAHILKTQAVRRAVRREMQGRAERGRARREQRRAALLKARRYAVEIAANYSQAFVTFMALLLGRLWNRLYDGVEFEHVEKLNEIGDGAEIIYVPCHRSHMDYLLLSYVIYRKGFAVPHIAAGVNLNMPVIGHFLRKGGAFFMRRSFKGDALYAAVFAKYLGFMMARGHPLEYFIEGGRSRTGRLLAPRAGMLSMTVRSYLRDPKRPVVFMPVYFGYERIVEGRTYIGELSGLPKQKESVFGLLKSLSVLRSKFGKVHVNLGQPIVLDELLQRHNPQWRSAPVEDEESPPDWIGHAGRRTRRRHHRRHQRRRRRDAHQPGRHGRARHTAPGLAGSRPGAPGRALSAPAARRAVRAAGHRDRRQRRANDPLRRVDGHARAAAAPARRHHAHERRARRARDLLPQQHPASVRHAVAARVLLRQQRAHAHRGHPAPRVAGLSVYIARSCSCAGRKRRSAPWPIRCSMPLPA